MSESELEQLRYPIGRHEPNPAFGMSHLKMCIADFEKLPYDLELAVSHLTDAELETPYRPGGWTIRQVVNHCADSHSNGLIRLKLALTETNPTVKPYLEAAWANLPDSREFDIKPALQILYGTHARWVTLLHHLQEADLSRTYEHPQYQARYTIAHLVSLYAWHGRHHFNHIRIAKESFA